MIGPYPVYSSWIVKGSNPTNKQTQEDHWVGTKTITSFLPHVLSFCSSTDHENDNVMYLSACSYVSLSDLENYNCRRIFKAFIYKVYDEYLHVILTKEASVRWTLVHVYCMNSYSLSSQNHWVKIWCFSEYLFTPVDTYCVAKIFLEKYISF